MRFAVGCAWFQHHTARNKLLAGPTALVEISLQAGLAFAQGEPQNYAGCVISRRFKFLPQHEFEALTAKQQRDYVAEAFDALNRAVATPEVESDMRADGAGSGAVATAADAAIQPSAQSFTWLSIADFKRLTPAQKEAYIGQIAEHFELAKRPPTPEL